MKQDKNKGKQLIRNSTAEFLIFTGQAGELIMFIFDYSYRWFYEDGFGKHYQILNLPESFDEAQTVYITACLLKFYQQLRIYEEKSYDFQPFNLEKARSVYIMYPKFWTGD